jgi:very-short-patch-repair endonuclease
LRTRDHVDSVIARRSARLDGVLTTDQLVDAGLSKKAIQKRSERGALHRLYPGVYAIGDPLIGLRGRWRAAVCACGHDAVLSHRDAAMLLGLLRSSRREIDVTVPSQAGRRLGGIDHHTALLLPRDKVLENDLPCTSPARTALDLAAVLAQRPFERAYEQGWILGLFDLRALEDVAARAGRHRGAGPLQAQMARHLGRTLTRSDLEELFLSIVDSAAIPRPELNIDIPVPGEEINVDCVWRAQRLVVELDSRRYHLDNPGAFTRDRRRDRLLRLAGWDPIRFTDEELEHHHDEVARTVIDLLSRASA